MIGHGGISRVAMSSALGFVAPGLLMSCLVDATDPGQGAGSAKSSGGARSSSSGASSAGGDGAACSCTSILGSPTWSGSESVTLVCGETTQQEVDNVSGITFQETVSGFNFTDPAGCTYDFVQSGKAAMLASPVTCNRMTDAGLVTEVWSSGTITISDGHHVNGQFSGGLSEATVGCSITATLSLDR
jgi:hypothetical protein